MYLKFDPVICFYVKPDKLEYLHMIHLTTCQRGCMNATEDEPLRLSVNKNVIKVRQTFEQHIKTNGDALLLISNQPSHARAAGISKHPKGVSDPPLVGSARKYMESLAENY